MILTHCARLKDFTHTSWAEIRAFYEICMTNRIVENVEMRDCLYFRFDNFRSRRSDASDYC